MKKWKAIKKWYFNLKRDLYYYNWDPDPNYKPIGLLRFFIRMKIEKYKQSHCKHEWDVECNISPDSGSETFTCKKCGLILPEIIYY